MNRVRVPQPEPASVRRVRGRSRRWMRTGHAPGDALFGRVEARGMRDDPLEREADRIAHDVVSPRARGAQPAPVRVHTPPAPGTDDAPPPASVERAVAGQGRPLEPALRKEMDRRFGYDFSRVRIHTGPLAEGAAEELDARAFTTGNDVVFGAGQFDAGTVEGRHLLAHELAHVVQQAAWPAPGPVVMRAPRDQQKVETRPRFDPAKAAARAQALIGAYQGRLVSEGGALEEVFNRAGNLYDPVKRRAHASELAAITDFLDHGFPDGRTVAVVRVIPGRKGKKSADLQIDFAEGPPAQVELTSVTSAPAIRGQAAATIRPVVFPDKKTTRGGLLEETRARLPDTGSVKDAIYRKAVDAKQLRAPIQETLPGGGTRPVTAGGYVVIDLPFGKVNAGTIDQAMKEMEPNIDPVVKGIVFRFRNTTDAGTRTERVFYQRGENGFVGNPWNPGTLGAAKPGIVPPGAASPPSPPAPAAPGANAAAEPAPPSQKPGAAQAHVSAPVPATADKVETSTGAAGQPAAKRAPVRLPVLQPGPAAPRRGAAGAPAPGKPAVPPAALAATATAKATADAAAAPPAPTKTGAAAPTTPRPAAGPAPSASASRPGIAPVATPAFTSDRSRSVGAGLAGGPGMAGAHGSFAAQATQRSGRGTTTTQAFGADANVTVNFKEESGAGPNRYRVTLTLTLGAGGSLGAGRERGLGASLSASASGSLIRSYSHLLTAEEAKQYMDAAKSGAGGAYEELQVLKMVAGGARDEARTYLLQAQGEGAKALAAMKEGDVSTTTVQGQATAALGAGTRGATPVGVQFGVSRGGKVTQDIAIVNGRYVVTISVVGEKGTTVGATVSEGAVSGGFSRQSGQTGTSTVQFSLDPKDPAFQSRMDEIQSIRDTQALHQYAQRRPELVQATAEGKGTSTLDTTSASLAGVGLNIVSGGAYNEAEILDAGGKGHRYEGSGTGGASLTFANQAVASSTQTDAFEATVTSAKQVSGQTSSTRAETNYSRSLLKAADRPFQTLAGLVTKGAPVLEESSTTGGKVLTDASFPALAELAKDPKKWGQAWHGSVDTAIGWEATRKKVLAARGDNDRIAKALAEFEHGGAGRSRTLENALGDTGVRFEFPDEIADQKPVYDQLVVGNPIVHARQLASDGKTDEALSELRDVNAQLTKLSRKIQSQQTDAIDSAALAEMLARIGERQAQLRAELRQLAPPPAVHHVETPKQAGAPAAGQPAEAQPDPAAAAEEAAKREDRNARIDHYVRACLQLRDAESAAFAAINQEFGAFFGPSYGDIAARLNKLKNETYPQWDKLVDQLKAVYRERGDSPERAQQFAPDRAQWQALYNRAFKGY